MISLMNFTLVYFRLKILLSQSIFKKLVFPNFIFFADTYIGEGFHFINFYSPFCPPCQSLSEHWKRLAKVYKGIVS